MIRYLCGCLFIAVLSVSPVSADTSLKTAGTVSNLKGAVLAVQNAAFRKLEIGSEVYIGDILSTGANARLEIKMVDDGVFSLAQKTSFVVSDYTFGTGNDNVIVELLSGAMDGVSGQIAKVKDSPLTIKTPQATIGIRGTKFFIGHMAEDGKLHVAHWSGGGVHIQNFAGETLIQGAGHGVIIDHDRYVPPAPTLWSEEKRAKAKAMVRIEP